MPSRAPGATWSFAPAESAAHWTGLPPRGTGVAAVTDAMRRILIASLLVGTALLGSACVLSTTSPEAPVIRGRRLYTEHGCYGCHTVGAAGTPIAPDLSRAGARYSEAELARLLRDPATHKPGAHMPKLALTDAETRALAAYLATLR
jgi:mono/diheme cytochrome c family protein